MRESRVSLPEWKRLISRRGLLAAAGGIATIGLVGANWRTLSSSTGYQPLLDVGDAMGQRLQRLVMGSRPLAREYHREQISPNHPSRGGFGASYIDPDPAYDVMVAQKFRDWRLKVDGLVTKPSQFSLSELREMPSRTQITMHCCDEGWSAIGEWSGVPLGWLLQHVGIQQRARYVVFHAMDKLLGQNIFDSVDLFDAFHPQTILAHRFNGEPLPRGHGAPLRLRLELQIGYKNLKHLQRIEVLDSLQSVAGGRGGLYQMFGYQWYAGQ